MEVVFALPVVLIPLIIPVITGLMAKSFGRRFWPWFLLGMSLPFIANIILLCLPDRSKTEIRELRPVENDEVFDYLFCHEESKSVFTS